MEAKEKRRNEKKSMSYEKVNNGFPFFGNFLIKENIGINTKRKSVFGNNSRHTAMHTTDLTHKKRR